MIYGWSSENRREGTREGNESGDWCTDEVK